MIPPGARVRLAPKARVQRDRVSGKAFLLYPERGLELSESAARIVAACGEGRTVTAIVDELTAASSLERPSPGQFLWNVPDGWQQGRGQHLFAVCIDELGGGLPTGCQEPHRYEIFGTLGETVTTPAQPDLQVSCAEVIAAATGMPDITAGGALSVQVVRFAYDDDGTMVVGDRGPVSDAGAQGIGSAFCLITPTRDVQHLTASLRELGAGPVPLS